jgi:alkaline phosphatase D
MFVKAPPVADASPATEYQFFGQVSIAAANQVMTVRRDNSGTVLWSRDLEPQAP